MTKKLSCGRVKRIMNKKDGLYKMREGIHPEYYNTTVKCACGVTFETGSTKEKLNVEICSSCHPFFTGKQKIADSGGQVDKFKKRYGDKVQ